jgi:hypothetical protein
MQKEFETLVDNVTSAQTERRNKELHQGFDVSNKNGKRILKHFESYRLFTMNLPMNFNKRKINIFKSFDF